MRRMDYLHVVELSFGHQRRNTKISESLINEIFKNIGKNIYINIKRGN